MLYGKLTVGYSLIGALFSVGGSFLGTYYVLDIIKRKNKQSIIVYALAMAILTSALLSLYKGVSSLVEDIDEGTVFLISLDDVC